MRGPLGRGELHGQNLQLRCANRSAQNRGEAPSPSGLRFSRPLPAQRGEVKRRRADKQNRSRDTLPRPSFANHNAKIDSPPAKRGRRSAERRIQPISAQHRQTLPLADARARKRAMQTSVRSLRTYLLAGRARLPALRRGSRQDSYIPAQPPGHKPSWDSVRAGVTPPSPVPVRVEAPHASAVVPKRMMPEAAPAQVARPARKHRTRSASESALAKASLDERDSR